MSKRAYMTHLNTWNTSHGQKNIRESNWQFDSQPLKVGNQPNFLAYKWFATYCWKALDKGYNFVSNLISIGALHAKLWGPKAARVPTLRISGFPLWSPKTKWHLDASLVARHRVYYKGEGVGFPQVRVVVNFMSLNLSMARPSTKMFQLCTN